jgi:tripartite-type tricarboxylate transporter receptor subunit TctC
MQTRAFFLRITLGAAALAACACSGNAPAQGYPNRAIRLVIPFAPGGTPDVIARVMAPHLERELGQSIVIDNRAGANGIIGTEIVARAAPDGYTLLKTPAALIINSLLYKKLPYDIERDLVPITNTASAQGYLLLVHPSVPANTVEEFIALAKKRPAELPFGSPGFGNSLHLAHEYFNARAGIRMVHVPYKGLGPAFNALLAGEVTSVVMAPTIALQQIKAGKARPLAFTGDKRWPSLPDVPTMVEAGLAGFHLEAGWFGWFAPAGTPAAIVQRLNTEIRKSLQVPQVRDFITGGGYDIAGSTPAEFRAFLREDIKRYAEIARAAGIRPE